MTVPIDDQELVARVLQRDTEAISLFTREFAPILAREARVLLWRNQQHGVSPLAAERDDLVQHVWSAFLADPRALLSRWDPQIGSLKGYIAMFARGQILSQLRRGRRWVASTYPPPHLVELLTEDAVEIEGSVIARRQLAWAESVIAQEFSEREQELIRRVFVCQESTTQICEETGLSEDALYQAKSRLQKKLLELKRRMEGIPIGVSAKFTDNRQKSSTRGV